MNSDSPKSASMTRRILQYILGLAFMAFNVVLSKRSDLGLSPFSTAPAAVSNIVPSVSIGTATWVIHLLCIVVMIIVQKRITLKTVLTAFVGIGFGYLVDLFMLFVPPLEGFALRFCINVLGIFINAFGVALIVGADLMLPAPDQMLRTISVVSGKSYPLIKNIGDLFWVTLSAVSEVICIGLIPFTRGSSVGIGSVMSAILIGRLVKVYQKHLPINLVEKATL